MAVAAAAIPALLFAFQVAMVVSSSSVYFEAVERTPAKVILLLWAGLVSVVAGLMVYNRLHTPTATRFVLWVGRTISFVSVSVIGLSVFGWPRLDAAYSKDDGSLEFVFLFDKPSGPSWGVLSVSFLALLVCAALYSVLQYYGKRIGDEI